MGEQEELNYDELIEILGNLVSTLTDSHSPTEASRGLVISSNSSLTADASSTVTVESNNLNTANVKPDLSSRKLCDFSISQTDGINKNKQSSESNIDSAESTPIVKPKSYAGLTLQNVRAHEYAYQPQQKVRPSVGDDESSIFSVDQEGFFTSMHRESGVTCGPNNPHGRKGQHHSSTTDSSSTVCPSDASVISRDTVKAKRNKSFLSKIKKMTGKKSKSHKVQPPPPLRKTSLLNKSSVSEEDFPPPPTPTQLAFNMSTCLSEVSDHFDFTHMSLTGDSPASKNSGELVSPISKKLLNDTTESDPEAIYARLKKKTYINAESFPALCLVTPVPSDEEDSDFLTCSTVWRAEEAVKKISDKQSLDTCGTLPKSPNGTLSENNISGYSTWPRSPAKIVTSSPDTNKSGIYKEAKVVQTPKTLSIVPQGNIFEETIQISTKSVLPPAKTPDDTDTRCMTPTSFKSGSVSSERVPRPPRRKMPSAKTPSVSSLASGSSGSHSGLSEEQVGEIPAKYQHTITVTPRARLRDKMVNTTSGSRHSLGDRNVTTPTKSPMEHVYANVVLRKPAPFSQSCENSHLSSGALYTTAGPKAGSVPVLTQPPQNISMVDNGKDAASSDTVDGMSTWPKSGKKILLVSNMKKAESSLDNQTPHLSTFGPPTVIDGSQYVAIPVSISQVTRPSTLPISSSGGVVPASAQLIISSPTATKVCHQENPYRRSVCSPVTDEELEKFGLYDTSSDQWYNTMPRNFKTSQGGKPPRPDPAVRCHSLTRPRSAIIRSQSFSQTQTKLSEPLYPSITAMKHSISFPVKIQAKDTSDKNHRSWYDGLSDNEENRSRPVSQPLDWIPDPFSDLKPPVSTKRKRPKLDSDPPSHGAPFRLGTRSNFAAFQMASNQQSSPVCSSPGTSCTRIDDFTFTISSNAVVGEPSVESSNNSSRKRPSFSSFLKSPSPSSPQTPTWPVQSPDTSPVLVSSPNSKVSAFEALNQIRMDKQLKTPDSPVGSQNVFTPVAVEPSSPKESPSTPTAAAPVLNPAEADWGSRLSTIMEASESEAEGKSGPMSPVPRVLTQSPSRSLTLSIDSSNKSEHIPEETKSLSQSSKVQSSSNIRNRPSSLIQLIATKNNSDKLHHTPTVVPNKSSSVSHKKPGRATLISKSEADSLFNGNKTEKSESRTNRKSETDHKIVCSKDAKCGVKPEVSGTVTKLAVKCERPVAEKKCYAKSELPVNESKSGVKSEVKVSKVQNELRKTPGKVSNSNENAKVSSEPSKTVVKEPSKCSKTTNLTKTYQSHHEVTGQNKKEKVSESKSDKPPPGRGRSGSDAEKTEKKLVLPSLRAFKPSSLERPNRNRSSSLTSDRRKSLPSACTKSSGELSSVSSISCTDGDSQSSGSLASGSSGSVQSSHAEKMKAAKLAFLTQQSKNDIQSSSSGSSVDLRFARHSLGKSSTSLNRSNTSLNNMSLSSTSLNNLGPTMSVAVSDTSEKKEVNGERHKQSNSINKSMGDKKPNGLNQAGPGAHTALLEDIKNFKLKPASEKNMKHVERTAADRKATRAALEARNNNNRQTQISDDSAVLSILDNIKCSMKTYDFKSDDGSSAKESLNSSSEWLL